MDDASPDGTQDVARQLQKVYGEDHIVGETKLVFQGFTYNKSTSF